MYELYRVIFQNYSLYFTLYFFVFTRSRVQFENTSIEEPRIGSHFASLNLLICIQTEIEIVFLVFLLLSNAFGNSRADRENDLVAQDI